MKAKFNYKNTYYKVTKENECHHGYQYKDGLNILVDKFNNNPKASCVAGGLYFTDYDHLPEYLGYGVWIREVTIPTDAKVVLEPEGNKWRCDKIIFGNKYHIENDFDKWFDPKKFNWNYSFYLAQFCSDHFDKWFDPKKFNWNYSDYLAEYCSDHFDKWFDPEKYNWNYSFYLAQFCSDHFDKWFDPEKYDFRYSQYLSKYCKEHKEKWGKYRWIILYGL